MNLTICLSFFLICSNGIFAFTMMTVNSRTNKFNFQMMAEKQRSCLIVGGTRFSGLYLWKELHDRGHSVTLFNRGKTALKKLPRESEADFEKRKAATKFITGDRQSPESLQKLGSENFDVIYDMNGREATDTIPLADMFKGRLEHFIYMSSAGVYKKSLHMPHIEVRLVDCCSNSICDTMYIIFWS